MSFPSWARNSISQTACNQTPMLKIDPVLSGHHGSRRHCRTMGFHPPKNYCFWSHGVPQKKASVVSPTAAALNFYKSFWSVLRSQALETPQLGFRELNGRKSCWTWPGSAPKPPRPSPEPSPEPCWTWLGFAPRLRGTFSGNSGTFSGTLHQSLHPVERDLALHQNCPDLLRNLRNLLRNLVELDPAPAPVHTGAILGWRPH